MILPVSLALFAGLLLYSAFQNVTVTDALRQALGRSPSGSGLGNLADNQLGGSTPVSNAGMGSSGGGMLSGSGTLSGHPELKAGISAVVATVLQQFPQLTITSTISGTHASGSYHYLGRAADIAGPQNVMDQAAAWIAHNLSGKLTEGIHNPGLSVKYRVPVPASFWGASTWAGHRNHIHLAV